MAKVNKDGTISGLVNGMVFYVKNGKQFVRSRATSQPNPQTVSQMTHRTKQKLASALLGTIRQLIKTGYQKSDKTTPSHEFISHVVKDAVRGSYPKQYIDYSLLRVSRGKIPPPLELINERQNNSLILYWKKDLLHAESLKTDHLVILLINEAGESFVELKLATRQDETATLQLAEGFRNTIHCWAFYHNPEKFPYESREKVSDSVFFVIGDP